MTTDAFQELPQVTDGKRRSGLRAAAVLLLLLLLPLGLYAFYVIEQVDQLRTHNLQRLDYAADSITELLENVRTNIHSLYGPGVQRTARDAGCEFFDRQTRITLIEPDECANLPKNRDYKFRSLIMEVDGSTLQFRVTLVKRPRNDKHKDEAHGTGTGSAPVATGSPGSVPGAGRKSPEETSPEGIKGTWDEDVNAADAYSCEDEAKRGQEGRDKDGDTDDKQCTDVLIGAQLATLMDEIPFGEAFDSVMILDQTGALVGSAMPPRRPSVMAPPGGDVPVAAAPVRVQRIVGLSLDEGVGNERKTLDLISGATVIHPVDLAGSRFDLMCQPMPVRSTGAKSRSGVAGTATEPVAGPASWQLCGLVDRQRTFRQALAVAPYVSVLLLALMALCIVSWPVLKVVSLSPHERVWFSDFYLMLLSTMALTMLLTVALFDTTTYLELRERSYQRLETLADHLGRRVRTEIDAMYRQLDTYDRIVSGATQSPRIAKIRSLVRSAPKESLSITALLREQDERSGWYGPADAFALSLPPPTLYPALESIFWIRPCDGQQFAKATPLRANTPAVGLAKRAYFDAIKSDRLWHVRDQYGEGEKRFFAETSASLTTGTFFAVLSARSGLSDIVGPVEPPEKSAGFDGRWRDCEPPEDRRFGVALTGKFESLRFPVLAPGVGFAIVDTAGKVLVHSDRRRSVYDNLLEDPGIAERVRAVMAVGASARLYAQYQTRPHQFYLRPVPDMPWYVVTFVEDEVLRTLNTEVLVNTMAIVGAYLALALLVTFVYILINGRSPPHWVWPRRQPQFRPIYLWLLWGLSAQLAIALLSLNLLQGWMLLAAGALLPIPAVLAVVVAARAAQQVSASPGHALPQVARRQQFLAAVSASLACGMFAIVLWQDPVAAAFVQPGPWSMLAMICATLALMSAAISLDQDNEPVSPPALATAYLHWLERLRDPLLPHILCSVLVWLLVAALPGYAFFKFSLQEEIVRWMQMEQSYVARASEWRDCGIREDDRKIPVPEGTSRRELIYKASREQQGLYGGGLNAIYPASLLLQELSAYDPGQGDKLQSEEVGILRARRELLAKHAPVYNEATTFARYIEQPGLHDSDRVSGASVHWSWLKNRERGAAVLAYHAATAGACGSAPLHMAGRPRIVEPVPGGWVGLLGLLLGVGALLALAVFSTRKVFFGEIEDEDGPGDGASAELRAQIEGPEPQDLPGLSRLVEEAARLQEAGMEIPLNTLRQLAGNGISRRSMVDRILKFATPWYQVLWDRLDTDEQLLLHQLATERFANPRQTECVRQLLQRKLLRRDPVLRLMNSSFDAFVQAQAVTPEISSLESEGARWHKLRRVMVVLLVLSLLFLTFTQRDAVEVWIAYLGTAAAGSAGVLKLLGMLNRPGEQTTGR